MLFFCEYQQAMLVGINLKRREKEKALFFNELVKYEYFTITAISNM